MDVGDTGALLHALSLDAPPAAGWFGLIPFCHRRLYAAAGEPFDPSKYYLSGSQFYLAGGGSRYAAVRAPDLDQALQAFLAPRGLQQAGDMELELLEVADGVHVVRVRTPELCEADGFAWTTRLDLFERSAAASVYTDVLAFHDARRPWSDHHIGLALGPSEAGTGLPDVPTRDVYLGLADLVPELSPQKFWGESQNLELGL